MIGSAHDAAEGSQGSGRAMNIRQWWSGCALALVAAGAAIAQPTSTIARLVQVEGNVLVSEGDALVAAAEGQRLISGTRILTTARSRAIVVYDTGCEIRLRENERFMVRQGRCPPLA